MKHKTLQDSFLNYYWVNVTERYFDFDGKTSREDYWMFTLWSFVITVIFAIVSAGLLGAIYSIFILFPQTAINVRRYHDLGMSGWTFFVFFILFNFSIDKIVQLKQFPQNISKFVNKQNDYFLELITAKS